MRQVESHKRGVRLTSRNAPYYIQAYFILWKLNSLMQRLRNDSGIHSPRKSEPNPFGHPCWLMEATVCWFGDYYCMICANIVEIIKSQIQDGTTTRPSTKMSMSVVHGRKNTFGCDKQEICAWPLDCRAKKKFQGGLKVSISWLTASEIA